MSPTRREAMLVLIRRAKTEIDVALLYIEQDDDQELAHEHALAAIAQCTKACEAYTARDLRCEAHDVDLNEETGCPIHGCALHRCTPSE